MHGGLSTDPRTEAGRAAIRDSNRRQLQSVSQFIDSGLAASFTSHSPTSLQPRAEERRESVQAPNALAPSRNAVHARESQAVFTRPGSG